MNNSDLFDRKKYKLLASQNLKNGWKVPVLITLMICGIEFFLNIGNVIQGCTQANNDVIIGSDAFSFNFESKDLSKNSIIAGLISIVSFCITAILTIACTKFYLSVAKGENLKFNDFINALSLWAKGILESLWSGLFTFLWSLLFFVPGIIKSISYSQAFFILAEFPEVSVIEALKISMKITKGYKSDLFVMYLSFVGWFLLSIPTCGIGLLWLIPYYSTTKAHAYRFLMQNAISHNRVSYEELFKKPMNA